MVKTSKKYFSSKYWSKRLKSIGFPVYQEPSIITSFIRAGFRAPKWLSDKDLLDICETYLEAVYLTRLTGERHVVDHIIPFNANLATGLHVPSNIRVVPYIVNAKKHKSYEPFPEKPLPKEFQNKYYFHMAK